MSDWLFGKCTTPTYGAEVFDLIALPRVQANIDAEDTYQGGQFVALDGSGTADVIVDAFGKPVRKRRIGMNLHPLAPMPAWWPVLSMRRNYRPPWMLFDQSQPNLLTGRQRLMQSDWYGATSALLIPRADGATVMTTGSPANVVQLGVSAPSAAQVLATFPPVLPTASYFLGCTVYGPAAWQLTMKMDWYDAAGVIIGAGTTIGPYALANRVNDAAYLDGTLTAARIGANFVSPALAAYGKPKFTCTVNPCTISDFTFTPGKFDPGPAMKLVNITRLPEAHLQQGTMPLSAEFVEL